jgi:2-keto-4-pentenoate hydratase/2-oxohepta-3-ene-1,7-dioic acid hydratase in catechol pathway
MKIARIATNEGHETFAIVDSKNNDLVAIREEIAKQIGLSFPHSLEDFLYSTPATDKVKEHLDKLPYVHKLSEFRILPPIMNSFKVICLAFNYSDQASWVRFGKNPPKDPVIYMKARTSLIGPYDKIICPKFVKQLDYEGELALAIGKRCKGISEVDAFNCIAGYFVLNDVSARDIQFLDKQYTRAKSFDTFGPCGPWITTPDEIPDPHNLHIVTKVNEEIRQDSTTANLVLNINKIIHSLSKVMTLEPGDIISTGTPSGTALSLSSHLKYLQDRDVIEVKIEKLGKLRNQIVFVD